MNKLKKMALQVSSFVFVELDYIVILVDVRTLHWLCIVLIIDVTMLDPGILDNSEVPAICFIFGSYSLIGTVL